MSVFGRYALINEYDRMHNPSQKEGFEAKDPLHVAKDKGLHIIVLVGKGCGHCDRIKKVIADENLLVDVVDSREPRAQTLMPKSAGVPAWYARDMQTGKIVHHSVGGGDSNRVRKFASEALQAKQQGKVLN